MSTPVVVLMGVFVSVVGMGLVYLGFRETDAIASMYASIFRLKSPPVLLIRVTFVGIGLAAVAMGVVIVVIALTMVSKSF